MLKNEPLTFLLLKKLCYSGEVLLTHLWHFCDANSLWSMFYKYRTSAYTPGALQLLLSLHLKKKNQVNNA